MTKQFWNFQINGEINEQGMGGSKQADATAVKKRKHVSKRNKHTILPEKLIV